MKITARRLTAWLLALVTTFAIAALSQVSYTAESAGEALLRLSWRARGERIEECRPLTEEERRTLPPHMQQQEVCEGKLSPYELGVALDGEELVEDTIHGGGVREDRPLYVNRDLYVEPGSYATRVWFRRLEADPESEPDPQAIPRQLQLDTTLTVASGEILLVTYSPERRRLVVLGPRD